MTDWLQATSYRPQATGYKLQATSYKLQAKNILLPNFCINLKPEACGLHPEI